MVNTLLQLLLAITCVFSFWCGPTGALPLDQRWETSIARPHFVSPMQIPGYAPGRLDICVKCKVPSPSDISNPLQLSLLPSHLLIPPFLPPPISILASCPRIPVRVLWERILKLMQNMASHDSSFGDIRQQLHVFTESVVAFAGVIVRTTAIKPCYRRETERWRCKFRSIQSASSCLFRLILFNGR